MIPLIWRHSFGETKRVDAFFAGTLTETRPSTSPDLSPSTGPAGDRAWPFWPAVPLYPYGNRRTLRREIVPNTIWTFEQLQGILYVIVPIRMTVIRLEAGGLLVYAPVAPTPECIVLLRELEAQHGSVKHIILPTVSGIEHKIFAGPFARRCPQAQVYVAPDQWSFPINLPLSWLGLPFGRTQRLPSDPAALKNLPFSSEFDIAILGPIDLNIGPFEEVALHHRASKTLLVTDTVMSIPADPPEVLVQEPYPLLFHARDRAQDPIENTPENRRKGWQRITLFSFYFRPSKLADVDWKAVFRDIKHASDRSRQAYFGLFPFQWEPGWKDAFTTLQADGQPFVAPVLQRLILNRDPEQVLDWAKTVSQWSFEQMIPAHFDAPVAMSGSQFEQIFGFLQGTEGDRQNGVLPEEEFELINQIDQRLKGVTPPARG